MTREPPTKKWLEASLEAFTDFRFEPERFVERGDWVFVPVHAYGRGKGSGAPFTARAAAPVGQREAS